MVLLGLVAFERYLARDDVVFLRDDGPAQWIVHDAPVQLRARLSEERAVAFRTGFELERVPEVAILEYQALRDATVYVSGTELPAPDPGAWSTTRRLVITGWLRPGYNELALVVRNDDGPPALRARCDALDLSTGADWGASTGGEWTPARLASDRPPPALALQVESGTASLTKRLPVWALLFALGAGLVLAHRRIPLADRLARPRMLQWILFGLWLLLGANNFWRLHPDIGFDVSAHMDYIRFVAQRGALPLADDGWQMFQMPLFYLLAAIPWSVLSSTLGVAEAAVGLRWIPLLCGALQVLVARRALAAAFPRQEGLQALGLVFVAFLPMNLYMSQYVGNEPLAGLFSALTLTFLVEILRDPSRAESGRVQLWLSLALAAAILSKVTALLLVPVAVAVLLHARRGRAGMVVAGRLLLFLAVLAGWPFARNFAEYGTPFVFSSSSVNWWQDPGYRVAEDLLRFGRALERPVFASTAGFWNALWSTMWTDGQMSSIVAVRSFPGWNLPFVFAGAWLALPMVAAMLAGAVRGLVRRDAVVLLAVACGLVYLAALLQQYVALPIYSTAKASYTLGLLPAYAILFCAGIEPAMRRRAGRAVVAGLVVAWAGFAGIGFFVT